MDVKSVIITGADTALKAGLQEAFAQSRGASVLSGPADMFVYVIWPGLPDGPACEADLDALPARYEACALGLLREAGTALPRLARGGRLCFITPASSSVNLAGESGGGCAQMISAACNMAVRILFNRLRPEGYTFRVYAARADDRDEAAYAAAYFLRDRSLDPDSPAHSDENRLVMRDRYEREIPW